MRVKEVMHPVVKTIAADRPLAEAGELMERLGIEHLVVKEHREIVGVLSDGDVLRRGGRGTVAEAMTAAIVTIDESETIQRAANMMRGHDIKSLVVTRNQKLAGIVTTTDLLEIVARSGHKERMVMRDRGIRKRARLPRSAGPAHV